MPFVTNLALSGECRRCSIYICERLHNDVDLIWIIYDTAQMFACSPSQLIRGILSTLFEKCSVKLVTKLFDNVRVTWGFRVLPCMGLRLHRR